MTLWQGYGSANKSGTKKDLSSGNVINTDTTRQAATIGRTTGTGNSTTSASLATDRASTETGTDATTGHMTIGTPEVTNDTVIMTLSIVTTKQLVTMSGTRQMMTIKDARSVSLYPYN